MEKGLILQKSHPPIELLYCEEFERIDEAFYREKRVQGWGRAKKEALINGKENMLHKLSACKNDTHSFNNPNNTLSALRHFDSTQ